MRFELAVHEEVEDGPLAVELLLDISTQGIEAERYAVLGIGGHVRVGRLFEAEGVDEGIRIERNVIPLPNQAGGFLQPPGPGGSMAAAVG